MKTVYKIIVLIGTFCLLTKITGAQSPPASPSATVSLEPTSQVDKQIQDLKDKVANKVAELRKKERKAYSGTINSIKANTVFFKTADDKDLEAAVDESLTKLYLISGSTKKEIQLSDLKKSDYIIVTGVLSGKSITTNNIYKDELYFVKTGKITEVNKNDYYIKVLTSEKDNFTLDIETFTKTNLMNIKTLEIERSGFLKVKEGDSVHFIYKKTGEEKEQNRFSAQSLLIIPQEYFIK